MGYNGSFAMFKKEVKNLSLRMMYHFPAFDVWSI